MKTVSQRPVGIANNASLTAEIDLDHYDLGAIIMPSAWTAANLTFAASDVSGGTFVPVYDDAGNEVVVTAAASEALTLGTVTKNLKPFRFIKVRSGTNASAVNQQAARTLILLLVKSDRG